MKRGQEDLLVRLAFGDLSVEESAALEMKARQDPEMAKTLQSYRSLRAELRDMAEIPQHQMSNERLRDAILGQGLKAAPAPSHDLSWIWAAGLACAVVAGLFVAIGQWRKPPAEVKIMDVAKSAPAARSDFPRLAFSSLPVRIAPGDQASRKLKPAARTASTPNPAELVAYRHRKHSPGYRVAQGELAQYAFNQRPNDEDLGSSNATGPDSASTPANPVAPASLKPVSSTSAGDVVLIDAQRDEATGTRTATEVTSATNVVVGG